MRLGPPLLAILTSALAVGCQPGPESLAGKARGRNLLLVTIDTLRADKLGCYGGPEELTPVLDGLASKGVVFEQAQSAIPLTLPSHATIFSGVYPPRHGLRDNAAGRLPPTLDTLATRLEAAGYATGASVAAFVLDGRFGLERGFGFYDDDVAPESLMGNLDSERPAAEVNAAALAWLETDPPEPFFLWVHYFDPHDPYEPPEPWASRHADAPYDGEVAATDAALGELLKALAGRGLMDGTLVAVLGDHGEGLGYYGEWAHGLFIYQSTLHVPFILSAPGVLDPRRVSSPVRTVDVAPTLLALLDVTPLEETDGVPLLPALVGRSMELDVYAESLYAERNLGWAPLRMLRVGPLKLIEAPEPELYDLANDPGEQQNLAPAEPDRLADLRERLATLGAALEVGVAPEEVADGETRERLAALGYFGGGGASSSGDSPPDPKAKREVWARIVEAMGLLGAKDYQQAARVLSEARQEEPESDLVARLLATARFRGGEPLLALPLLEEQVERHPEDPTPRLSLAAVLEELGDHAGAAGHYHEVLATDAANTEAMAGLSGLAARLGGREEAVSWMRRAHEAAPDRQAFALKLARLELQSGRLPEAEALYRRILESHPRQRQALGTLAFLLARRGRYDEALELLDRRLEVFPDDIKAHYNRAIILEDAGRLTEAAGAYQAFLARAPAELAREAAQARRFLTRHGASGSASRPQEEKGP